MLILNLALIFEKFEPKSFIMGILGQKYRRSNLNKILLVPYLEDVDFKSNIGFRNFGTQILYYGYCGSKSINFLIAKFYLYPIWKVLISILTYVFQKFRAPILKFGQFGPKSISFLILTKFCA